MTTRFSVPLGGGQLVEQVTAQRWDAAGGGATGPVVVLAHGAGSSLDHPTHRGVCAAVAAAGHPVVGFNFAYAEAGRRAPDRMPRLQACLSAIIAAVTQIWPDRPLVLGGRSMGGRVASLMVAAGTPAAGLALLNYPVMPGNRRPDSQPRTGHWEHLTGPVLFCQGTRDRLFDRDVFAAALPLLRAATVTVADVAEADHSFAVPRRTGRTAEDVYAEVARHISTWIATDIREDAPV